MGQRFLDFFGWVFVINELAGKVLFISSHVEVAVAAQVEKDCPFLAFLLGLPSFFNRAAHGVRGFGCDEDTFAFRESDRRFEALQLRVADRLDDARMMEQADKRRHAVIAQASSMDSRGNEIMAE